MGKDFAKFTAEVGKGINIKDTHVEVKLFIPLTAAMKHLEFLSSNQGEKINVALGNPQLAFNFDDEEEDDPMYRKHTGRFVTADASGVVTRVEGQEEDQNQAKLELDGTGENEEGGGQSDTEDQQGPNEREGQEQSEFDGSQPEDDGMDDYEREIMGESSGDLPEWMRDTSGDLDDDQKGEAVVDTSESELAAEPELEAASKPAAAEVDKEVLEQYILENQPRFEGMEFDFPELIRKKTVEKATWVELCKGTGTTSGVLKGKIEKYKEKVAELITAGA